MNTTEIIKSEQDGSAAKIKGYTKNLDFYTRAAHHAIELNHIIMNEHVEFPQIPPGILSMIYGHAETMIRRYKDAIEKENNKQDE